MLKALLTCLALLPLSACAPLPIMKAPPLAVAVSGNESRPATYRDLPLYSGQLVLSESGGPASLLFSLFVEEFSPFVHAGVLVFEDGEPIVYEARGQIRLETGSVPTDTIKGRIRARHLGKLLRRQNYVAIYNPPVGTDVDSMVAYVREQYRAHLPFDAYFNTEDTEQVYCTEFLALALAAGGVPLPPTTPIRSNPSIAVVRDWLKLASDSVYLAESMTSPERHSMTLSRKHTIRQIRLYQAARAELHRRFSADQKLGNVFTWSRGALRFRPEIETFLAQAQTLETRQESLTDTQARTAVSRLAQSMFGPYPSYADKTPKAGLAQHSP